MPELTLILKFCSHFYYFTSEFSRKFLTVALNYVQNLDFTKEEGKFAI